MPSPLSVDLRERVVAAVAAGAFCHQAAARFGVSVSSASRWSERFQSEGQVAAKPSGGDHASHRIEAHADLILGLYEARAEIFLHELRDSLAGGTACRPAPAACGASSGGIGSPVKRGGSRV